MYKANQPKVEYNVNTNGKQAVGIKVKNEGIIVLFPIGYPEVDNESNIISSDVKTLLRLISKQAKKGIQSTEEQSIFPVLLAERIIQNFLEHGLYKEKQEVVELQSKGRINWKKTIHYPQPFIQNKTIYANLFYSHINYFVEGQIQEIQKWCLGLISKVIGVVFAFHYPQTKIQYGKKQIKQILEEALKQTNQDYQLETLGLLLSFVNELNFEQIEDYQKGLKYYQFEYVWQDLVDSIGCKNKSKYLPQAGYYNLDDSYMMYNVKPLLPDTVVELEGEDFIFVLDAKYYGNGHLPDQYNIFKQVRYGEYVYKVSGKKNVINAFILPGCLGKEKVLVKGYAKLQNKELQNEEALYEKMQNEEVQDGEVLYEKAQNEEVQDGEVLYEKVQNEESRNVEILCEKEEEKGYEKIYVCYVDTKSMVENPEKMMLKVLEVLKLLNSK